MYAPGAPPSERPWPYALVYHQDEEPVKPDCSIFVDLSDINNVQFWRQMKINWSL